MEFEAASVEGIPCHRKCTRDLLLVYENRDAIEAKVQNLLTFHYRDVSLRPGHKGSRLVRLGQPLIEI